MLAPPGAPAPDRRDRSPKSFASPLRRAAGCAPREPALRDAEESSAGSRLDVRRHVEGLRPPTSPHQEFKLSIDPLFRREGARYRRALSVAAQHALVLCVYEKSQIQALDRSQPLLPRSAPAFLSTGRPSEG